MNKTDYFYPSADGETTIHAILWLPEGQPSAVLQIAHGMQEYIDRYDAFASWLTEQGIAIAGNDHLGHGQSVTSDEKLGYFAKQDGNACLLQDIHSLRIHMQELYPGVPYFVLGHSMGSFLIRQYIQLHGEGLSGAVIMGTGTQPAAALSLGKAVSRLIAVFRGWEYRSQLVYSMAMGSYNKRFQTPGRNNDWLTKDVTIVEQYNQSPWCTFRFTLNGYYNLFYSIQQAQDRTRINTIPKELPLLIVSGADDPVGSYGKGVQAAWQKYVSAGLKNVRIRLYENDRHEILNETDRAEVWKDILTWINETADAR